MTFERAHAALQGVARAMAIAAGYGLIGLSLAICAEIVLRRTLNFSMQGVDEIGGYALAVTCAFGFGYTLLHKAHTRIDLLLRRLGPTLQAVLNLISALLMAGIAVFIAWRAFATLMRSVGYGSLAATPLQTPIWIPQGIWTAGLCFFALAAVFLAVRAVAALASAGVAEVNRQVGPLSLEQEIEEETGHHGSAERR